MTVFNRFLALAAIFSLLFFSAALQAQQVAYVEGEAILQSMPEYKRAQSELETYGKQLEKQLKGQEEKIMAEYQKAMERSQRGEMSPIEEKKVQEKLAQMQQDFAASQQKAEKDLMQKEQDLTKPLYEKYKMALEAVAKANNFSYIVDKQLLLYSAGGIDATPKVKAQLGI